MSVLIIAGLGNPGLQYEHTRHNIGFLLIDALARQTGEKWRKESRFEAHLIHTTLHDKLLLLVKPLTFMNESGRCLEALCRYYKIERQALIVIYDEINIELGRVKISLAGSAGGHHGVENIFYHLGDGFVRYRIGIGPKIPPKIEIKDFVLGKFTTYEQSIVNKKMAEYLTGLQLLVDRGPILAMNKVNQYSRINESNGNKA